MSKSTHTPEFRAMVAQEYLNGVGSSYYLADKYHIGRATIQKWVALYRAHGIEAFITSPGNKSYSKDFRENVRLKRKLKENDILIQLLKKVKEFERM